jgi:antitoxin component of RelBE/YafQ-DinJ toxin-antitoxin module
MKNRVIRVDDATWSEFAEFCDEKGISRSDWVRMVMRDALSDWRRQQRRDARESAGS